MFQGLRGHPSRRTDSENWAKSQKGQLTGALADLVTIHIVGGAYGMDTFAIRSVKTAPGVTLALLQFPPQTKQKDT